MRKLCIIIAWLCTYGLIAQSSAGKQEENPIIFVEGLLGFGNGSADGILIGYSLNYQFKGNLVTFRQHYLTTKDKNRRQDLSDAFLFLFPAYINGNSFNEFALLYGRRLIFDGSSISFSGGISTTNAVYRDLVDGQRTRESLNYIAFPYEISFKFFNRDKRRYRVFYGLIPVGNPTALSRSIGVKLYGSLGKESYIGLGITIGIGWHKVY